MLVPRKDGCALPLRDGTVDAVAVDMPFGVRCGKSSANRRLYPAALREIRRVLRPGGQCQLLLTDLWLLAQALQEPEWPSEVTLPMSGGQAQGEGVQQQQPLHKAKKAKKLPKKEWRRLRREAMGQMLGTESEAAAAAAEAAETAVAMATAAAAGSAAGGGAEAAAEQEVQLQAQAKQQQEQESMPPPPWAPRWDVRRVVPANIGGLAAYVVDIRAHQLI